MFPVASESDFCKSLLFIGEYIPKWSCDFENGLCHWLQMTEDQVDFKHGKGSDVGWKDHTKKTGDGISISTIIDFSQQNLIITSIFASSLTA